MERKTYIVTARAGDWVAGRRVTPGQELRLTDSEAEHERRVGTIEPKKAPPPAPAPAFTRVSGSRRGRRSGEG